MRIVLEGADGSGKSWLATTLAKGYGLTRHNEGPPPPNVNLLGHYGAKLLATDQVVHDRLSLGELVYGPIHRGVDRLGERGWRIFQRLMRARGVKQIICLPPYEICFKAWKNRHGEMITDDSSYRRVYGRYRELSKTVDGYVYDWTATGAFNQLCAWLEKPAPTLPDNYLGNPEARVLLVGDRGARPMSEVPNLPFFGTLHSSGYLWEALELAGIAEDVALVNAHVWIPRPYGNAIISTQIPPDRFTTIVALGYEASRALDVQRIAHRKIPHPQWVRRFKNHNLPEYADQLRGAYDDRPTLASVNE